MKTEFETYKSRKIDFVQNITTGNNHIKVYTITNELVVSQEGSNAFF
jgi:hypothetical protein